MPVEIFNKIAFEKALENFNFKSLGLQQGNLAYLVDVNQYAKIKIYSSIAPDGISRDTGNDSIRAWLVTPEQKPIGGKTQKYVTRTKGWQARLNDMLTSITKIGKFIQPCPVCQKLLAVSTKHKGLAYIFCTEDITRTQGPRHFPFTKLDTKTGEKIP